MASVTAEQYLLPTGEDEVGAAAAAAARLADPLGPRQRRPLTELTPAAVRQRLQQKYGPRAEASRLAAAAATTRRLVSRAVSGVSRSSNCLCGVIGVRCDLCAL